MPPKMHARPSARSQNQDLRSANSCTFASAILYCACVCVRVRLLCSLTRGRSGMQSPQPELRSRPLTFRAGLTRSRDGGRFPSASARHASHTFGPREPAASHAHTTLLGASGARRCGSLDCAPWSLRASSTRPRATAAAATRAPRGLWASCTCAPRRSARRRPSRASPRSRACPPESAGFRAGAALKRGGRDERL